jgi:hypothetical protein
VNVQIGDYAIYVTLDRLSETSHKSASRSSATFRDSRASVRRLLLPDVGYLLDSGDPYSNAATLETLERGL